MKIILIVALLLLPTLSHSDTLIFQNGSRVDCLTTKTSGDKIFCDRYKGVRVGYPIDSIVEVVRSEEAPAAPIIQKRLKTRQAPEAAKPISTQATPSEPSPPFSIVIFIIVALFVLGLSLRPIRMALGLLMIIVGSIACLTLLGLIVGIPMIFFGGILVFIR